MAANVNDSVKAKGTNTLDKIKKLSTKNKILLLLATILVIAISSLLTYWLVNAVKKRKSLSLYTSAAEKSKSEDTSKSKPSQAAAKATDISSRKASKAGAAQSSAAPSSTGQEAAGKKSSKSGGKRSRTRSSSKSSGSPGESPSFLLGIKDIRLANMEAALAASKGA